MAVIEQKLPLECIMGMTSMNVSLPEELKEYAEAQTKNGYSTPSEYIRELIRTDQKRRAKDKLDSMLLEGLRSGDSIPVDGRFWDDLKQEAMIQLAARKKSTKK
jgi:antitoxin ParD1/3/4